MLYIAFIEQWPGWLEPGLTYQGKIGLLVRVVSIEQPNHQNLLIGNTMRFVEILFCSRGARGDSSHMVSCWEVLLF